MFGVLKKSAAASRLGLLAGSLIVVSGAVVVPLSGSAGAAQDTSVQIDTGSGPQVYPFPPSNTIADGTQVDLVCPGQATDAENGTSGTPSSCPQFAYQAGGQAPTLTMIECQLVAGGDPPQNTSPTECDNQTDPGFTVSPYPDGSFDVTFQTGKNPVVYALPGGFPASAITCDATHACVWLVSESKTDFTKPKAFSGPFFISRTSPATPEAPFPVMLPIIGGGGLAVGAVFFARRRRHAAAGRAAA